MLITENFTARSTFVDLDLQILNWTFQLHPPVSKLEGANQKIWTSKKKFGRQICHSSDCADSKRF